jgi:ornithine cyclodeaminase/alanine dehydrogenase-like protein (mu-crystallin family)
MKTKEGAKVHHGLAAGVMDREAVHAELGEVAAGRKPGRTHPDQIIIVDSAGTALQDAAAARSVLERAVSAGAGWWVDRSA